MNIRKTLQVWAFSFIVLNLVGKTALHILLIMVDHEKPIFWRSAVGSSLII